MPHVQNQSQQGLILSKVSHTGVQLAAHRLHVAQDGYECSLTQNPYLKPFFSSSVFISVCVCNVWSKTTLLLFQCGPEMPKVWMLLGGRYILASSRFSWLQVVPGLWLHHSNSCLCLQCLLFSPCVFCLLWRNLSLDLGHPWVIQDDSFSRSLTSQHLQRPSFQKSTGD